ncbi:MAG: hypothetical protein AB1540_05565 [Bdellovibrionota bacterium]
MLKILVIEAEDQVPLVDTEIHFEDSTRTYPKKISKVLFFYDDDHWQLTCI